MSIIKLNSQNERKVRTTMSGLLTHTGNEIKEILEAVRILTRNIEGGVHSKGYN